MLKVLIAIAALFMGGDSVAFVGVRGETCLATIARSKQIFGYHEQDIPKAQINTVLDDIATICGMELASRTAKARHKHEY